MLGGAALATSGMSEQSRPHVVLGAALVVVALRTSWTGARLLDDRIVVRNVFRSYQVRWDDVTAVEMVDTPFRFVAGGMGLRRRTTVLRRRDGSSLPVHATQRVGGLGSWSAADEPTTVVDAAWRRATGSQRGSAGPPP